MTKLDELEKEIPANGELYSDKVFLKIGSNTLKKILESNWDNQKHKMTINYCNIYCF